MTGSLPADCVCSAPYPSKFSTPFWDSCNFKTIIKYIIVDDTQQDTAVCVSSRRYIPPATIELEAKNVELQEENATFQEINEDFMNNCYRLMMRFVPCRKICRSPGRKQTKRRNGLQGKNTIGKPADVDKKEYMFDRFCLILRWFNSIIREKSGIKYFPGVM